MSEDTPRTGWGMVYVACGARFIAEATDAVRSAKAHMPELPAVLFADGAVPAGSLFDEVRATGAGLAMKQQKMHALLHSPFARTLYLDTDTLLAAPIHEVLDIIEDGFDFAAALSAYYAPGLRADGGDLRADGVPIAFPNVNAGVMAMAHTPATQAFLQDWFDLHAQWGGNGQDQYPMRVALYRAHLRWAPLPPNYNYRTVQPAIANGEIKVLHGRHADLAGLAARLNRDRRMRGSHPAVPGGRMLMIGNKRPRGGLVDWALGKAYQWLKER